MADKKYLDLEGLQDVAGKVNVRLKTVDTMPVSANNGAVRLYTGATTGTYTKGRIYQYQTSTASWIDITPFSIDIVTTLPSAPKANQIVMYLGTTTADTINGHAYYYANSNWYDLGCFYRSSQLAPVFSTSASYAVGALVTYNDALYVCTTAHSGAWNASHFTATNVSSRLSVLDTKIDSIPKAVVPKGTVAFASLPALSTVDVGWMYNISDDFTTTSDFVIPGISESAGSNVYCIEVDVSGTMTKKWDVFAAGGNVVVDQTYDATSTNPQSGTAVAQAIEQSITSVLNTSF